MARVDAEMSIIDHGEAPEFFSDQVMEARRFWLDMRPADGAGLAVVCAGREVCAADYIIDRQGHDYLSVEFVASGSGTLVLDGVEYDLAPGTVFSYGPGVPHIITSAGGGPMIKYFLDLAGSEVQKLLADASLYPAGVIYLGGHSALAEAFDLLMHEGLVDHEGAGSICAALSRYLLLKMGNTGFSYGARSSLAFETYQRCREYIRVHHLELTGVGEAADRCNIDLAYLCRLFRRFDTLTPYQYLVRLKIRRAVELLHKPGAMVKQVADELGFADQYHFSRVFKRVHGIPPSKFMKLGR